MSEDTQSEPNYARKRDDSYSISSYGAFMLVCEADASTLNEVFAKTDPDELRRLADSLSDNIVEMMGSGDKDGAKELAYKQYALRHLAYENEDRFKVSGYNSDPQEQNESEQPEQGSLFG
jgi:hypothetical protein